MQSENVCYRGLFSTFKQWYEEGGSLGRSFWDIRTWKRQNGFVQGIRKGMSEKMLIPFFLVQKLGFAFLRVH